MALPFHHRITRQVAMLTLLAVAGSMDACLHLPSASKSEEARSSARITRGEIDGAHYANVYEVIRALHPNWLQSRSNQRGEVQVHLDDSRLGGVEALRTLTTDNITFIEFVDPVDAAARWGRRHEHGAILIVTREP